MRPIIFVLALAACTDPGHTDLEVHVTSSHGEPLADATVAVVCQGDGTAIATDDAGLATFPFYGDVDLSPCTLTTSLAGFVTDQRVGLEVTVDVALVEVTP